jgi:hypothetical protein
MAKIELIKPDEASSAATSMCMEVRIWGQAGDLAQVNYNR